MVQSQDICYHGLIPSPNKFTAYAMMSCEKARLRVHWVQQHAGSMLL